MKKKERVCAMKRIFWGLLVVIIVFAAMPAAVFALSGQPYEIEELDIELEIPDEYVVFTRETDANDPKFSQFNTTKEVLTSWMEGTNAYLVGFDNLLNYEITVLTGDSLPGDMVLDENTPINFAMLNDTMLLTIGDSVKEGYASEGITVTKTQVYPTDQTKFLQLYAEYTNSTVGQVIAIQNFTIYNGKVICIALNSYNGRIDTSTEARLLDILDSITFTEPLQAPAIPETEAFKYRESQSGVTFTVPANWSETPLENTRKILKAKFTSNVDGDTIMYGFMDLWNSGWSAEDKQGHERSEIDNSFLSDLEIAVYLGVEPKDVSKVNYGGYDYFKINTNTSKLLYESFGVTIDMTQLVRIENGYMYCFYFSGNSWNNSNYADFEALLETVKYPENNLEGSVNQSPAPSGAPEPTVTGASEQNELEENRQLTVRSSGRETDYMDRFRPENLLLSLLITIALYSLPIIIYRYAIRRRPVGRKAAKIIAIVYGVVALIVMSVILMITNGSAVSSGPIVFWSFVNYWMLKSGAQDEAEQSSENPPTSGGTGGLQGEQTQEGWQQEKTQSGFQREQTETAQKAEQTESPYNVDSRNEFTDQKNGSQSASQNTQTNNSTWEIQNMQDEYERMVREYETAQKDHEASDKPNRD